MAERSGVAVLLSAYNGEKYIARQLDSILAQDMDEPLTVLVRDDGSTDGTRAILRDYAAHCPALEVIEGENLGLTESFFALLRAALTRDFEYFAFCDQDDEWLPDKLSCALSALRREKDGTPLLYGACSYLTDEALQETGALTQRKLRPLTFYNTAIQNICPGHNQVLDRALAQLVAARSEDTAGIYSPDLWIANAAAVTGRIVFDDTPHTRYRQHASNQLGYGEGRLAWLAGRVQRLKKQESRKMSTQLERFTRLFADALTAEQTEELRRFFAAQESFSKRLSYVFSTRLYRQRSGETLAFKVLYLLGAYRPLPPAEKGE